ncbi:MAG: hypothetical protein U0670_19515 [Anaerolineae bacterium]
MPDRDLNILQSNPAFNQLPSVTSAEHPNRNLLAYLDHESAVRCILLPKNVLTDQLAAHIEVTAQDQDGNPVEWNLGLALSATMGWS